MPYATLRYKAYVALGYAGGTRDREDFHASQVKTAWGLNEQGFPRVNFCLQQGAW
ncbi:hypothetical protein SAMN05216316_0119 [Nitrosovibrio sp. Nv6]|nr:hypothetical protein SAMN05216316_0119 [Nitrosovibrio sp. Nv6]